MVLIITSTYVDSHMLNSISMKYDVLREKDVLGLNINPNSLFSDVIVMTLSIPPYVIDILPRTPNERNGSLIFVRNSEEEMVIYEELELRATFRTGSSDETRRST